MTNKPGVTKEDEIIRQNGARGIEDARTSLVSSITEHQGVIERTSARSIVPNFLSLGFLLASLGLVTAAHAPAAEAHEKGLMAASFGTAAAGLICGFNARDEGRKILSERALETQSGDLAYLDHLVEKRTGIPVVRLPDDFVVDPDYAAFLKKTKAPAPALS